MRLTIDGLLEELNKLHADTERDLRHHREGCWDGVDSYVSRLDGKLDAYEEIFVLLTGEAPEQHRYPY
jgi:hypothetical protein